MWSVALVMGVGSHRLRLWSFSLTAVALTATVLDGAAWLWTEHRVVLPEALPLTQLASLLVGLSVLGHLVETRSKREINRLSGPYVPPGRVGEMNEDPARDSMSARAAEMTVLFADVRGFTTLLHMREASRTHRPHRTGTGCGPTSRSRMRRASYGAWGSQTWSTHRRC